MQTEIRAEGSSFAQGKECTCGGTSLTYLALSRMEFIETPIFSESWEDIGKDDDALATLQTKLMIEPDAGDVIPRTGGLRKITDPGERQRNARRRPRHLLLGAG